MINFTPVAVNAVGNAALFNNPLGELDTVLINMKDGEMVGAATTLTIAGGAVTITGGFHTIAAEGAATTDNLDTISGGQPGQIIYIQADAGDTIKVTTDGNIRAATGSVLILSGSKLFPLIFDGANWRPLVNNSLVGEVVPMTTVSVAVASVDITGIPTINGPLLLVFGFRDDGADERGSLEITVNGETVTFQSISAGESSAGDGRAQDTNDFRLGDTNAQTVTLPGSTAPAGFLGTGTLLIHSGESSQRVWFEFLGSAIFGEATNQINVTRAGGRHSVGSAAVLDQITITSFAGDNITGGFYALYALGG